MNRSIKTAVNFSLGIHLAVVVIVFIFSGKVPQQEVRQFVALMDASWLDVDGPEKVAEKPVESPVRQPPPRKDPVAEPPKAQHQVSNPVAEKIPAKNKPLPPEKEPVKERIVTPVPQAGRKADIPTPPKKEPDTRKSERKIEKVVPPAKPVERVVQKVDRPVTPVPAVNQSQSQRDQAIRQITELNRTLTSQLKTPVDVKMSSGSSSIQINYAQLVVHEVQSKWNPILSELYRGQSVLIAIVVDRTGRVIDKKIQQPSGKPEVDRAAQDTLERLRFIAPFDPSDTEPKRSYQILLKVGD
jgi:TonB family protein